MTSFRIPTRIKLLPNFIGQSLQKWWILNFQKREDITFRLCFFSCESYFDYLYCSLDSIKRCVHNSRYEVYIFSDEEQPLTEAQIEKIIKLVPGTTVKSWPKSMGWGETQIANIWEAYMLAAGGANDRDVIARIDSDVFFFNDRIFRLIEKTDADLIGDGHYVGLRYTQGGCYFFRAGAVRKIAKLIERHSMKALVDELPIKVEDVAAFEFAKKLNLKVWLTWFMMFPDELGHELCINAWSKAKFSCVHFVMKNKDAMLGAYQKETSS